MRDYRIIYTMELWYKFHLLIPLNVAGTDQAALARGRSRDDPPPKLHPPGSSLESWTADPWMPIGKECYEVHPHRDTYGKVIGWKFTKSAKTWLNRKPIVVRASSEDIAWDLASKITTPPSLPDYAGPGWKLALTSEISPYDAVDFGCGAIGTPDIIESAPSP